MDVTRLNFEEVLTELDSVLDQATFLSIDGEFTGLNSGPDVKPYDSLTQYYEKLRSGSMDFLLVQFGLSAFTYNEQTAQYSSRSYNFYVFPRGNNRMAPDCRFMCQASSINFLSTQNFDFNKLFKEGIPYLTATEEEKMTKRINERRRIREEGLEFISITDEDRPFIADVCSKIEDFLKTGEEELALDQCNAFMRRLIFQEVRLRWPRKLRAESRGDSYNQTVFVCKVGTKAEEAKKEEQKRQQEQKEIREAVGLSRLLRKISNVKKPIVGHNMLLDLCHIVQQFFGPLPDSYSEFKTLMHNLFPLLIDTKHMSHSVSLKSQLHSSMLGHVYERMSRSPFTMPDVVLVEGRCYDNAVCHEAGYDSFITGMCFIGMANYLGSQHSLKLQKVLPDSFLIRPFHNKLLVARLKDIPYIDLVGSDISPNRDHVFHVTFPKEWKINNVTQMFVGYGGAQISWLSDTTAYAALHKREQVSVLIKKIRRSKRLGVCSIQTYRSYHGELNGTPYIDDHKMKPPPPPEPVATPEISPEDENEVEAEEKEEDKGWECATGRRKRKRNKEAAAAENGKPEEKKKPFDITTWDT